MSTASTQYLARSTGPPQNGCPRIADTSCPRNYGTSDHRLHKVHQFTGSNVGDPCRPVRKIRPCSAGRTRRGCTLHWEPRHRGPDATQPRVTVRPKPPVLLGATSTMIPLASRRGRVGQPPPEAGPGDSREATVTHHGPSQNGSSCPLRLRPPRGVRSRPSIPPSSVLSASLRFALRPPLRASLACVFRRSLEVRRALVSELNTGCTARHARSMGIREIQTFSPPFCWSSPSAAAAIPSSSPW